MQTNVHLLQVKQPLDLYKRHKIEINMPNPELKFSSSGNRLWLAVAFTFFSLLAAVSVQAQTGEVKVGIVLMHGKGGSPLKHVSDLANSLTDKGVLVANLDMPWSGRRNYDVSVQAAEAEVEAALTSLRDKGAQKLFVGGHSQGGLFALYFATRHVVDGIIAITPGGNPASPVFREKLGEHVAMARQLIAEGKGEEKARLADYEGAKGLYPINASPSTYLTWFDPDGALNQLKAIQRMNSAIPVLYIVPTNDYPGLLKLKQKMFDALPSNPRNKLYEPDATHLGSPSASVNEIFDWMTSIANGR